MCNLIGRSLVDINADCHIYTNDISVGTGEVKQIVSSLSVKVNVSDFFYDLLLPLIENDEIQRVVRYRTYIVNGISMALIVAVNKFNVFNSYTLKMHISPEVVKEYDKNCQFTILTHLYFRRFSFTLQTKNIRETLRA